MSGKTPPTPVKPTTNATGGYVETLRNPVSGPISSGFGPRTAPKAGASKNHKGIDFAVPTGTPVAAAGSGVVSFVGVKSGYGNVVEITHDDNTVTRYAHLSAFGVAVGNPVVGGQIIAKSGATGNVTGAHLHYEVIRNGQQVNPLANTVGINAGNRNNPATFTATNQNDQALANNLAALNINQDEIIQKLISGEHFDDNSANDYDNLTYHWRLFATGDTEVIGAAETLSNGDLQKFYQKLNAFEQVTIAESGVTTYAIDEVVMDAVVGTDPQVGSTKYTSIEMKITEPNGVNFLDALRNAALQLGIRNYQKSFYYLELTFKGYNTDGTINLKPFDGVIPNGGHWIWTVSITDIDVNLSAGGGSYNLKMIPLTDTLLQGTYNLVPANLHPSGTTLGAFMDDFCVRLTNVWDKIKGQSGIVRYKAKFHPVADVLTADQVRAMSVAPKEQDLSPTSGFDFTTGTTTAQIAQGFSISGVLDAVMTACEQAQKLACDELIKQGNTTYRQSILWRMEPEVHLPDFDPLYNEYYHDITLHIYGFRSHAAVLMPQDTNLTNDQTQKAILADLARRNFLPKKYEYLFTGVNSEVIDMDLSFNLSFQALLPSLAQNTQEQAQAQARVAAPGAAPTALQPDANTQRRTQEAQTGAQVGITQADLAQTVTQLQTKVDAARKADPQDKEALDKAIAEYNTAYAALQAQRATTIATREQLKSARPATALKSDYSRTFGEDLTGNRSEYELGADRENEAFPITVGVYSPNVSDTVGLPGQAHNGKSVYGAVLNQVYGPLAKQFFAVSITIKGDPFWLGPGSFEEAIRRQTEEYDPKHPNYSEGANCFLFRMRYPLGQDQTDQIIIRNNETVTGIYQANKVQHKFVDGKFTQVLQGQRIAILNLYSTLYKQLHPNPQTSGVQPTPGTS